MAPRRSPPRPLAVLPPGVLPRAAAALLLLLALAACSPGPGPAEAALAPQAEDPVDPYLAELARLDDAELTARFVEIADRALADGKEFVYDPRKPAHLELRAAFLESEARGLRPRADGPRIVVDLFVAWACAPWHGPRLFPPGTGTPGWTFGTSGDEEARDVAAGEDGELAIVGWTDGHLLARNAGGRDAFVCRYAADGTVRWARQFGGAGDDLGLGVALDADGDVYVAGRTDDRLGSSGGGRPDGFARRFDGAGRPLWTDIIGAPAEDDDAMRVAVHGEVVHVVGSTRSALAGRRRGYIDGYLRSYDRAGAVQRTEQFAYASETYPRDVATGAGGEVYVVGTALSGGYRGDRFEPWLSQHGFASRFGAAGGAVWTRSIGGFGLADAGGVAVDAGGDVYVAGSADHPLGAVHLGSRDAFVRKLDPAGSELWTQQFGTGSWDAASAVGVDRNGDVVVAGVTRGSFGGAAAGGRDGFVAELDPGSGALAWTQQFGGGGDDVPHALATTAAGATRVVGGSRSVPPGTAFVTNHDDAGQPIPW